MTGPTQGELDALYAELVEHLAAATPEAALARAARLLLLLAEEIGDVDRVRRCLAASGHEPPRG
jgi:hypothetical protein